jgi:hypothetical protein
LRECDSLDDVALRVLDDGTALPGSVEAALSDDPLRGGIDLLLTPLLDNSGFDASLWVEELYRTPLLALSAPGSPVTVQQLTEGRVLTVPGWPGPMLTAAAKVEGHAPPRVDPASTDPHALLVLAGAGLGTVVLPADVAALVDVRARAQEWVPILHRGGILDIAVGMVSHHDASRRIDRLRTSLRLAARKTGHAGNPSPEAELSAPPGNAS